MFEDHMKQLTEKLKSAKWTIQNAKNPYPAKYLLNTNLPTIKATKPQMFKDNVFYIVKAPNGKLDLYVEKGLGRPKPLASNMRWREAWAFLKKNSIR